MKMKILDLKYWHLESLVKIRLLVVVFATTVYTGNAQEFPKASSYYKMIINIMYQDREIKEYQKKALEIKIRSGKFTSEDSAKYVERIKTKKLNLQITQNNTEMKGVFKNALSKKEGLSNYFGTNKLADLIKKIPDKNRLHSKKELSDTEINLVEKSSRTSLNGKHAFSAPIKVKRKTFVVYHTMRIGIRNGYNEIIIYKICKKNNFILIKRIPTLKGIM